MVVVLAGRIGRLEPGDPVADVDAVDQVVGVEQLECPVDAGPPHRPLAASSKSKCVLDLKRTQSAVMAREQVDQLVAGGATVVAGALKHGSSVFGPIRLRLRRHHRKVSPGHVGVGSRSAV
jgi:hypothetical protein